MSLQSLIWAVRAHAAATYSDGWDEIVECWDDSDIAEVLVLEGATTDAEAIAAIGAIVATRHAYADDIRGHGGLFDEESLGSGPNRYPHPDRCA